MFHIIDSLRNEIIDEHIYLIKQRIYTQLLM